jgi:hypothetical protein
MAYSLQQLFPGISNERATALAWGGLYDTSAWNALSASEQATILNINHQEKNIYQEQQVHSVFKYKNRRK